MPGPYLWADEHVELEGNTMNPDHADHDTNDMPRAVEHALRKRNAMDDELCRVVAGEVWRDMQQAYDDIYGMWREEMRAARELERERDRLREALEKIASSNCTSPVAIMLAEIARDALEGKP
jgi:hypothetical protein